MPDEQRKYGDKSKQKIFSIVAIALVIILGVTQLLQPERSVAAYCKVYQQENAKLVHASGDTYSTTVFSHSSNNPHDFAVALGDMDKVAPKDIEPEVRGLQAVFAKIDKDPTQAISASLSGIGPESSVTDWTKTHCAESS